MLSTRPHVFASIFLRCSAEGEWAQMDADGFSISVFSIRRVGPPLPETKRAAEMIGCPELQTHSFAFNGDGLFHETLPESRLFEH